MRNNPFRLQLLLVTVLLNTACTMPNQYPSTEQIGLKSTYAHSTATLPETPVIATRVIPFLEIPSTQYSPTETTQSSTQSILKETATRIDMTPEENAMIDITISIGNSTFPAKLYDNDTTRALLAQFPLDIHMSELNGREKFFHLPANLPYSSTERPTTIHAGEIMLWSGNSLVLFYNTFSNTFGGYVRLGYVEDISQLADALGASEIQVQFGINGGEQ